MSKLHDDQCSSLILYHSPWLALVGNPRPNGLQATVDFFFAPYTVWPWCMVQGAIGKLRVGVVKTCNN